jgi:hypothetical protein
VAAQTAPTVRGTPSVWRRMRHLSALASAKEHARITRILCELEGVDSEHFAADWAAWQARFRQAGAVTRRAQAEVIADELGVEVEEVEAEAAEIAAQALAVWRQGW